MSLRLVWVENTAMVGGADCGQAGMIGQSAARLGIVLIGQSAECGRNGGIYSFL